MNYYALTAFFSFLATFFLAFWVLSRDFKSPLLRSYALANLSVSFWAFFYFFWQLASTYHEAYFFLKMLMYGATFMPVFLFHFILNYLEILPQKKWELFFVYLCGIAFLFCIKNDLLFSRLRPKMFFKFWPDAGPVMPLFLLFFFLIICYSLYLLFRDYQKAKGHQKTRDFYLFIGLLIAVISGSPNYALWYDIPLPPFLNPFFVVYVGLIAYAILRHHLMDIEVVVKRSLVFAGLFAAVLVVYSVPLLIFGVLFQQSLGVSRWLATGIAIFAVLFGYERLKNFLIEITDRYLFQKKYEYRKALVELGKETTRLMKVETFTKILNRNVVRIIRLSGSSVAILDRKKRHYVFLAGARTHRDNLKKIISCENILVLALENSDYLLVGDLERKVKDERLNELEKEKIKKLIKIFKEFKSVLCVPSRFEKRILGFMFFGEKLSGDPYSEEDLDLFVTLSRQIALAINNAFLYEESLEKERELARKELEKQTERIRRLASLGELAAGLAHEIRNPMTVLRSRAEDLKNELDNKKYLTEFAELTVKHIDRILDIVNNMLRFARDREKKVFSEVDVNSIIKDVLILVEGRFRAKSIEIEKNLKSSLKIIGDTGALQQAFLNVIMNSYDFMKEGGKLTVNTLDSGKEVLVEIVDTGCGIPKDKLENIFDPFYTTRAEGTGLGLSITYRIIQDHGGRIEFISEEGKGTQCRIFLPAS